MKLEDLYYPECRLKVRRGYTDEEQEFVFPTADPYHGEVEVFLKAVRDKDSSTIKSSYEDAFKTYQLTWTIRRTGTNT